jgi:aspartate aminotransferase
LGIFVSDNLPEHYADGMVVEETGRRAARPVGVAALSGTALRAFGGGYLRFSVADSVENIQIALERIDQWTRKNL